MKSIFFFTLLLTTSAIFGQNTIEVPKILVNTNGKAITTAKEWEEIRRPQIVNTFEDQVYGRILEMNNLKIIHSVSEYSATALNGMARRKQVNISLSDKLNGKEMDFEILIYYPLHATGPVYVASSQLDEWADPEGEYLSAYLASEVYKLYDLQGLQTREMPVVNFPLKNIHTGYHIKSGKHDITGYDWEQYLDFADFHLENY